MRGTTPRPPTPRPPQPHRCPHRRRRRQHRPHTPHRHATTHSTAATAAASRTHVDGDTNHTLAGSTRANELGGEHLSDFAECETDLRDSRTQFESQLAIAENSMAGDWPEERSQTVKAYQELREDLHEAFEDVLDA